MIYPEWSFNPRAREGRDPTCPIFPSRARCFNPRAREGRDDANILAATSGGVFQSTRPRGARLWCA